MLTKARRTGSWLAVIGTVIAVTSCGSSHDGPRSLVAISRPAPSAGSATPPGTGAPATGPASVRATVTTVVQRYFRASNRLPRTMSPAPLGRLMSRLCPCRAQIASVRAARRRGETFTGRATIHALRASVAGPATATVLADYAISRGGLVDASGHYVTVIKPRSHVHWLFALRRIGRRWKITRIGAA